MEEYYSSDRIYSCRGRCSSKRPSLLQKRNLYSSQYHPTYESKIKLIKFADETIDVAVCIGNNFSVSVVPSSKSVDLRDLLGFQCKITLFSQFENILSRALVQENSFEKDIAAFVNYLSKRVDEADIDSTLHQKLTFIFRANDLFD